MVSLGCWKVFSWGIVAPRPFQTSRKCYTGFQLWVCSPSRLGRRKCTRCSPWGDQRKLNSLNFMMACKHLKANTKTWHERHKMQRKWQWPDNCQWHVLDLYGNVLGSKFTFFEETCPNTSELHISTSLAGSPHTNCGAVRVPPATG